MAYKRILEDTRMDRRTEILQGNLEFPQQILKILGIEDDIDKIELVKEFWEHLWHNFLGEKGSVSKKVGETRLHLADTSINSVIWFEKFDNKDFFNSLLFHLSKAGWITSTIDNNYAWIEMNESKLMKWITKEELQNLRFKHKFAKYRFGKTKSVLKDVVQVNGKHITTGIVREGFMKAGNNVFQYDTKYILKYQNEIADNLKKGLDATNHDISYQEIIDELIDYYGVVENEYTLGNNISDSRGRSIFQCVKKLFNPVSSKDARACMVIKPQEFTMGGINSVYAFISELLGYRGKNIADKIQYGQQMYIARELPSLEKMRAEKNYDDLHIRIWLERIYENLDRYDYTKKWNVPIEIDALASVIQVMGVLTNDHDYMDMTNLINPEEFKDIWTRPYCSRKHVKKALTPPLYGSSAKPNQLWDKAKLEYTTQQLNAINKDLEIGIYSNAKNFKNFIIDHVVPQKKMEVEIWNDKFTIECNRFKWEETVQKTYPIYTSQQGIVKRITKSVQQVPDLGQFKRYFVTLLV